MADASSMPYWQTAQTYFDAGWSPIPLPFAQKSPVPDDVTGSTAPYVTAEQVARWVGRKGPAKFRGRPEMAKAGNLSFLPGNIALRLPPNVIGIDVDLWGGKAGADTLADAEKRWGPLPPTWTSTSRTDGSGIRFFRVPEGLKWRDVGPGIETIKWYHRYAIVMPSVHDKTGKRYMWIRPDGKRVADEFPAVEELPMLPAAWVAGLTEGQAYSGSGDAGDIDYDSAVEWLKEFGGGDPCSTMSTTLTKYTRSVREAGEDGGAHDRARDGAWAILGDAGLGHTGAEEAIRQLGAVFLTAVAGRRDGSAEWRRAVIKGVGKVRSELQRAGAPDSDPCDMFSEAKPTPASGRGAAGAGARVGSDTFDWERDDIGNAQRLRRAVGADARWMESRGTWVVYDAETSLWEAEGGNAAMTRRAMDVVRNMGKEAAYIEDVESQKAFKSWVKTSGGLQRLDAMIRITRSFPGIAVRADDLDADNAALHTRNGTIVLGEGGVEFRGRRHADLATFACPVDYVPGARSAVWDRFLLDVMPDPDDQRWVQTLFGYTLLGGNPERAFIIARGETTSGKSTMIEAIARVLGPYAGTYSQHLFREKRDEGPRVDLLTALAKRYLYCVEGNSDVPWHADVIKRATGNDRLRARGMNSNVYVEGIPAFTPWLAANVYPSIPNSDKALASRIFAVPFSRAILEKDRRMLDKLSASDVLPAILNWMVEGWEIYCSDGLTKPSVAAMDARLDAIESMSLFGEFLAECCEQGPEGEGYVTPAEEIRLRWIDWLMGHGHEDSRMHTSQWVGRKLSDNGFGRVRRSRPGSAGNEKVWYRVGVRLVRS